jgi:hypothetical protein
MTPKQLAIASHRVLKTLRKRPMPYKCTQLQTDTSYTVEQRLHILSYLRHNHYIKYISFVDIILTEKGKQASGYHTTRFDNWYNTRPRALRYLLSPVSVALVIGFCFFFYMRSKRDIYGNSYENSRFWNSKFHYYQYVTDSPGAAPRGIAKDADH